MEATVCRHWRKGDCKFGDQCRYLHCEPQVVPPPEAVNVENQLPTQRRVGIDIGGVIISISKGGQDTSFFGENFLDTPPTAGCFDAIKQIVNSCGNPLFPSQPTLRCWQRVFGFESRNQNPRKDEALVETPQLLRVRFKPHCLTGCRRTGIKEDHILFCLERWEKGPLAQQNNITIFIDDTIENLVRFLFSRPSLLPSIFLHPVTLSSFPHSFSRNMLKPPYHMSNN